MTLTTVQDNTAKTSAFVKTLEERVAYLESLLPSSGNSQGINPPVANPTDPNSPSNGLSLIIVHPADPITKGDDYSNGDSTGYGIKVVDPLGREIILPPSVVAPDPAKPTTSSDTQYVVIRGVIKWNSPTSSWGFYATDTTRGLTGIDITLSRVTITHPIVPSSAISSVYQGFFILSQTAGTASGAYIKSITITGASPWINLFYVVTMGGSPDMTEEFTGSVAVYCKV